MIFLIIAAIALFALLAWVAAGSYPTIEEVLDEMDRKEENASK